MSLKNAKVALISSDACNPPTFMHLRMFECAKNYIENEMNCHVTEGILHVNNFFSLTTEKEDYISNEQRFKLTKLCCKRSKWIKADNWKINECQNILTYLLTLVIHYQNYYDKEFGHDVVKIIFICENNLFSLLLTKEYSYYLGKFLCKFNMLVVSFSMSQKAIQDMFKNDCLKLYKNMIFLVKDFFNISCPTSQEVREALKKNKTIRYCTENDVVDYIEKYMLYKSVSKSLPNKSQLSLNCYNNTIDNNKHSYTCNKVHHNTYNDYDIMSKSYTNDTTDFGYDQNQTNDVEPIWTSLLLSDSKKSKSLENIFKNGEHSPMYDNLTFDEMLEANERWVAEMLKQAEKLEEDLNNKNCHNKKVSFSDEKKENKGSSKGNIFTVENGCIKNEDDDSNTPSIINNVEKFLNVYDSLYLSSKPKLSNTSVNFKKHIHNNDLRSDGNKKLSHETDKKYINNDLIDYGDVALESTV
uniref:CTP_transf_like domain-containing protein n=1 Tax=Parastrongyloides trichosuri TaxID=131310 RepID=A0A0N4ZC89_PARTI